MAIVVSVDYRAEAKFAAARDDDFAACEWAAANAASLDGDAGKLALAGQSAGGLATATAIAARDGVVTAPRHVVAVYPVAQSGDMPTPS